MKEISFIKTLTILGLHYYRDFKLEFEYPFTILVGENGGGKSTIMNILYSILRKRWLFLSGIGFDYVNIEFSSGNTIAFSHSELDVLKIDLESTIKTKNEPSSEITNSISQIVSSTKEKFNTIESVITNELKNHLLYLPSYRHVGEDLRIFRKDDDFFFADINYKDPLERELFLIKREVLIPSAFEKPAEYLKRYGWSEDLKKFIKIVNSYLVNTEITVASAERELVILNKISKEKVTSQQLSSGERQVLYIFSHVFLHNLKEIYILFDEPEINLSLPWQRRIVKDIVDTGKCTFLLAITHSPFIFDNDLDKFAKGINVCFQS